MAGYEPIAPRLLKLECVVCGSGFEYVKSRGRMRRFCSVECKRERNKRRLRAVECRGCGTEFFPGQVTKARRERGLYCSNLCWLRVHSASRRVHADDRECNRFHNHLRRARKHGVGYERFSAKEIFERDNWRCGLCGKKVDKRLKGPHPMSASLDHIVSLAQGGAHSRANTQCAHWICNSRKTFRSMGQLRLFG